MRKPIVAGNWKMNKLISETRVFVEEVKNSVGKADYCEMIICPSFVVLTELRDAAKNTSIFFGAQNMFWEEKGAYTGEISPAMLIDAGCRYAIIGHSERRQYFNETDENVNKKMHSAFKHGLIPIVCVGETLQERESGATFKIIEKQARSGLAGLNDETSKSVIIAYEPVWAIGTGKTATPQQAQEVHGFIRKLYSGIYDSKSGDRVRILYGGSIKPDNFAEIMKQPDIDGGLVGGASLEAKSFIKLVEITRK
jgi:triosephosphate isomerase